MEGDDTYGVLGVLDTVCVDTMTNRATCWSVVHAPDPGFWARD